MKPYKKLGTVKDGSKILGYSFMVQIKLIPRIYPLEMGKMRQLLREECKKLNMNYYDLVCYAELNEDRRSNKVLPKGYRCFRFMYTAKDNLILDQEVF